MKQMILVAISILIFIGGFAQTKTDEDILRLVAGNVLRNTSFQFINIKTEERFESTGKLNYSPDVRVESPYNQWEYWNGVLNIGMLQVGELLNDPKFINYSKRNFSFIFENINYFEKQYQDRVKGASLYQYFRMNKLDDCGAMAASLADVYQMEAKAEYLAYLQKAGDYILNTQERLEDGTLCRPTPRKMTIWADDLYMSVPFLARMSKITGNQQYVDFAIKQVENFAKYLNDPYSGMYFHCWFSDVQMNGVAHWGRCNGWIMVATTELLNNLPANHPKRSELINLLLRQIVGISRYQDKSGLWHQVLDKPDSYLESSCTAMFVYSIARAVNLGWIDKSYLSIAKNGWTGLLTKIQPDGQVQDICIGTGISNDIRFYYDRPVKLNDIHGLGAVLLAGVEILKSENQN